MICTEDSAKWNINDTSASLWNTAVTIMNASASRWNGMVQSAKTSNWNAVNLAIAHEVSNRGLAYNSAMNYKNMYAAIQPNTGKYCSATTAVDGNAMNWTNTFKSYSATYTNIGVQKAYSKVNSKSANWEQLKSSVDGSAGNWNGLYTFVHGFKNRYDERTGRGANYRFSGRTEVQPMVEPVTS